MEPEGPEAVAPNFNRRLSGVTATIVRLVPVQRRLGLDIVAFGVGLPDETPRITRTRLLALGPPGRRPFRIFHARRNVEMLFGLFLRDVLRRPWRLVFTSASQRTHSRYTRGLIRRMNAVIAVCEATQAYLEVPSRVILHGVDTGTFVPAPDRPALRRRLGLPEGKLVGCFGRVRHGKGTDLFVDAMLALLPERPDWNAVIFGRATEQHLAFERELKAKVAAAGMDDRIVFAGEVGVEAIAERYGALDLFVAPQRWEGFGLTPLEAMACAVPVVATRVGAFPELVVDGETGTLVERDDLAALTDATARLMDSRDRDAMGTRAREHVETSFTIEEEAVAINAVYERLWAAGPARTEMLDKETLTPT